MHLKPIAAGLLFTMANGVSNTMQTDSGNDQCIRFRKNSDPRPIDSDHLKVMTYGGRLRFIGANGMKCVKVPGLREILDMCRPNSKGVLGERCHAFYRQYYQILSESDSPPPMLNEENLSKLYIDKISDYDPTISVDVFGELAWVDNEVEVFQEAYRAFLASAR